MKKKSGAKLAVLYGFVPCQLGLCGPIDKKRKGIINRYLKGDDSLEFEIRLILREFKGAYSYYQLIARSNGISDSLDFRVVEAYWLGNSLLKKVRKADLVEMMKKEFLPLGKISPKKIEDLPDNAIPFHNFHVLSVGSVTGKFKGTRAGLELCRTSWGKVEEIEGNNITVLYNPLDFSGKMSFGKKIKRKIKWNKNILSQAEKGDWLSIHWNHAIEKINKNQLKNVKKYTREVLEK